MDGNSGEKCGRGIAAAKHVPFLMTLSIATENKWALAITTRATASSWSKKTWAYVLWTHRHLADIAL